MVAGEGRHEGCTYGGGEWDGDGGACWREWAPTRGAPTGVLSGMVMVARVGGSGTHEGCPYGSWGDGEGGAGWREGTHKGCPYRCWLARARLLGRFGGWGASPVE